jgi:hypothetical protein
MASYICSLSSEELGKTFFNILSAKKNDKLKEADL